MIFFPQKRFFLCTVFFPLNTLVLYTNKGMDFSWFIPADDCIVLPARLYYMIKDIMGTRLYPWGISIRIHFDQGEEPETGLGSNGHVDTL